MQLLQSHAAWRLGWPTSTSPNGPIEYCPAIRVNRFTTIARMAGPGREQCVVQAHDRRVRACGAKGRALNWRWDWHGLGPFSLEDMGWAYLHPLPAELQFPRLDFIPLAQVHLP
jgi:hypothetical protein